MPYNSQNLPFTLGQSELLDFTSSLAVEEGTCLFFSGGSYDTSEISYLCLFPREKIWIQAEKIFHARFNHVIEEYPCDDPWDSLKKFINPDQRSTRPGIPDWIGYFSYEMGAFSDREKALAFQESSIPKAQFLRPGIVLAVYHKKEEMIFHTRKEWASLWSENEQKLSESLSSIQKLKQFLNLFTSNIKKDPEKCSQNSVLNFEPLESYCKKIECVQELIREGEIYQINLSQEFEIKSMKSSYEIFKEVAHLNPASFMGYFNFLEFSIVSSSPERFLCKRGTRLETRPIKGTIKRGKTPTSDLLNQTELLHSKKETAELLMITDLMRNDLSKVSQSGTVITEKIWNCEAYANVFHLNSIIYAESKSNWHPLDIIRETFPAGSITGCPKLRAMELISQFEKRPRGIYTGSIGYFTSDGDFDFNVAIRTLLFQEGSITMGLGSAIVSDSVPEKEYQELWNKGESLIKAF